VPKAAFTRSWFKRFQYRRRKLIYRRGFRQTNLGSYLEKRSAPFPVAEYFPDSRNGKRMMLTKAEKAKLEDGF